MTYGNGELLAWFEERGITPYIHVKESPAPKTNLYRIEKFLYDPETNSYFISVHRKAAYLREADYTEISLMGHRKSNSEHLRESPRRRRNS